MFEIEPPELSTAHAEHYAAVPDCLAGQQARHRSIFRPAELPGVNRYGNWRTMYEGNVIWYRYWNVDEDDMALVGAIITVYRDGSMEVDEDGHGEGWIYPDLHDKNVRHLVPITPHTIPPYIHFLLSWNLRRCADVGGPLVGAEAIKTRNLGDSPPLVRPDYITDWHKLTRLTRAWLEDEAGFWDKYQWHYLRKALSDTLPRRTPHVGR